jgi:non-heme chloroperoxidase
VSRALVWAAGGVALTVAGSMLAARRWRAAHDPCAGDRDGLAGGEPFRVEVDDGAVLDGVIVGDGPTVVLAHCWTGSRAVWAPVATRLLERGHRVVLYDQRGHGASTLGPSPLSVSRLAADLCSVLETVDARRAVLGGHSMGGMTAQAFAIEYPDVVRKRLSALVLVSTAAALPSSRPLRGASRQVVASLGVERLLSGRAGPALVRGTVGKRARLAHLSATRDGFVAVAAPVRLAFLEALQQMDLRPGLAGIDLPTTVVVGRRDLLTPPRLGRAIAAAVPGAQLVEVPDGGHMLPFEEPDLLAHLISHAA